MIRWVFRWAFRLLILIVVLVVAGILLLDTFAREYAEYQLRRDTGMEVKIGRLHVGLIHPEVTIENLVIYNRADFGGSPFVEMPDLHVEYDRNLVSLNKFRFKLMRFNVAKINLVEDKNGRRNYDMLEGLVSEPNTKSNAAAQKLLGKVQFGGIDTLNLTLGKVTYMSMKQPDKVQEFNLNVDHQVYTGIKTQEDFAGVLFVALMKGGELFAGSTNGPNLLQLFSPKK